MRFAFVALFVFAACVGALALPGCSESDDSKRATATANEAETALKESIRIETEAARLVLSIRMVPEFGLEPQAVRKLGTSGLKTLDEADRLRADARKQLETAQRLYTSIDAMSTSDGFKKWVGMVVMFADKWGERLSHDEADSALRRKALNMLADGTANKNQKEYAALMEEIFASSKSGQSLMREVNRLSAEADGFAQSLQ